MYGRCESFFTAVGSTVCVLTPPNKKNSIFESLWVEKAVFMHILRTGCPTPIPILTTVFVWFVGGLSLVSWLSEQRFAFWPPKPQKLSFWKHLSWKSCFHAYLENRVSDSHSVSSYSFCLMYWRCDSCFKAIGTTVCVLTPETAKTQFLKAFELKKLFSCISWEPGVRFPFRFFLQFLFDVLEVCATFHGYRNTGLRFDPRNRKNSVSESLWIEKAVFMHILRTGSPIPIPFLLTVFVWCMGGVTHVSRLSEYRFAFWPSKPQKLNFWKPLSWKSCFHAYLDNWESASNSIFSNDFI